MGKSRVALIPFIFSFKCLSIHLSIPPYIHSLMHSHSHPSCSYLCTHPLTNTCILLCVRPWQMAPPSRSSQAPTVDFLQSFLLSLGCVISSCSDNISVFILLLPRAEILTQSRVCISPGWRTAIYSKELRKP